MIIITEVVQQDNKIRNFFQHLVVQLPHIERGTFDII